LATVHPTGWKKFVPAVRSRSCITRADVSTGSANACKSAVMNIAHTVIGMRNIFMPGARSMMMVVM